MGISAYFAVCVPLLSEQRSQLIIRESKDRFAGLDPISPGRLGVVNLRHTR